jgi:hypothetical protein
MIPQRDRLFLGLIIVVIIALVKIVMWAYKLLTSTG